MGCLGLGLGGGAVRDNLNLGNFLVFPSVSDLVLESSSLEFRVGAGDREDVSELPTGRRSFSAVKSRAVVMGLVQACELVFRFVASMWDRSPWTGSQWCTPVEAKGASTTLGNLAWRCT